MNYNSEIISGLFAVLVTVVEVRSSRDRKRTEQRAAVRAKENRLAMKMEVFAGSDFVDGARAGAIARALDERAVLLKEHIRTHVPVVDDAAKDVRRNVAYSGNEPCGKERRSTRDQER